MVTIEESQILENVTGGIVPILWTEEVIVIYIISQKIFILLNEPCNLTSLVKSLCCVVENKAFTEFSDSISRSLKIKLTGTFDVLIQNLHQF